jgi:molecular chaperone HtpG
MLDKVAKKEDKSEYNSFWTQFGPVLKEGLVEDYENRDEIFKLCRFVSTNSTSTTQDVSLEDYISRMPEKQKNIYYIVADNYQAAVSSPYLEALKKKNVEVLLMWERVDEWVMAQVHEFDGKNFVSVTSADLDLGELEDEADKAKREEVAKESEDLIKRMKDALGDKVEDIKVSSRLIDTPSCVISNGNMMTAQMRKLLEASGQKLPEEKFTLEINPEHELVKKMSEQTDAEQFKNWAELVFEQALLSDQGGLKDPTSFLKRINSLLLGK